MSVNHHGNTQPAIDQEEHEHYLEPATKRVLAYGFDGANKQILKTDNTGKLELSGSISGGVTTVFQGGSWDIRSLNSTATLFAVVNTAAAGQASIVLDTGSKWIGLATTVIGNSIAQPVAIQPPASGHLPISIDQTGSNNVVNVGTPTVFIGNPTLYAVVNTGAVGNTNSLATLYAGPNQIGSVTVSNTVNSITTISPRTDYVGLMSISGNVVLSAGTAFVGLSTVVTGNVGAAVVTVAPRTDYLGLVSVSGNVVNSAGANFIGLATVVNGAGSAYIGLVSVNGSVVNLAGTATIGIVRIATAANYIGLMSINGSVVNLAGTAQIGSVTVSSTGPGTAQIGSVTVSSIGPGTATIGIVRLTDRAWKTAPIALNATNFSGATIIVAAASVRYYITSLTLSTSSIVGMAFLNGPTYLAGNASIRMQFAAQSGLVETGSQQSPIYFGQAVQTNFLIATDTAAPISGRVVWYEE